MKGSTAWTYGTSPRLKKWAHSQRTSTFHRKYKITRSVYYMFRSTHRHFIGANEGNQLRKTLHKRSDTQATTASPGW